MGARPHVCLPCCLPAVCSLAEGVLLLHSKAPRRLCNPCTNSDGTRLARSCSCSVLDRYPTNGRLLRAYGRYLEWVAHRPGPAQRCYGEALRAGLRESLAELIADGGAGTVVAAGADEGRSAIGTLDERTDGLVVINAVGTIIAVNK